MKLHCEATLSQHEASAAVSEFFQLVKSLLPDDKYRMFLSLFRYPVDTVTLTERIFTALEKIFDGRNPVFKYEFLSPEDDEDWEQYRTKVLKCLNKWKTEGFETMKTAINSIVIVDLPSEQQNEQPDPYFYFLPITSVIDFETTDATQFEWVMFRQPENRVAVFDDGSYRVFQTKEGSHVEVDAEPIIENEHTLGYCPARFFWTTPLSYRDPKVKRSPISTVLSKLDMLLFFAVSNEHLNLYGRYPIYSAFATDCDYQHDETGEWCDGGFLKTRDGVHLLQSGSPKSCPVCQKRRLDGAGSFIEIDPPSQANDGADLRNPVQITKIDRDSLDYNNEDIERRKTEIYTAVTGYQGMSINDKAVNEKQVIAIFESLEAALKTPQQNFEQVMSWVDATICRLRYGSESFISASISLGTEHYIMTPTQLLEMYQAAKKAAFSISTLDMLEDRYYETEFRNNPEQLQRQRILNNLDPFRHKSNDEVSKMYGSNVIEYHDFMIKTNFSSFVMRFERENLPVTEFGTGVSFDQKIKSIRETMIGYANEMKPEEVAPIGEPPSV